MRGGGGGQSAVCAAEIGGLSGVELARGLNRLGVGPGVSARPLPGRAGNQEVRGLRPHPGAVRANTCCELPAFQVRFSF